MHRYTWYRRFLDSEKEVGTDEVIAVYGDPYMLGCFLLWHVHAYTFGDNTGKEVDFLLDTLRDQYGRVSEKKAREINPGLVSFLKDH